MASSGSRIRPQLDLRLHRRDSICRTVRPPDLGQIGSHKDARRTPPPLECGLTWAASERRFVELTSRRQPHVLADGGGQLAYLPSLRCWRSGWVGPIGNGRAARGFPDFAGHR